MSRPKADKAAKAAEADYDRAVAEWLAKNGEAAAALMRARK